MPFKNPGQRRAFFAAMKKKQDPSLKVEDPMKSIMKNLPKEVQQEHDPSKISVGKPTSFAKIKKLMKGKVK